MIETERLILRAWDDADLDAVLAMGSDERVMAYLGPLQSPADARDLIAGQIVNQSLFGHCFWPVERRSDQRLIGLCGLNPGPADTPLDGMVEIGWRLAYDAWGQGYAFEAASACLQWGWDRLDVPAIGAMTVAANARSRTLMERLGMTRLADGDFDHPALGPDDPLRPHLTYRIERP